MSAAIHYDLDMYKIPRASVDAEAIAQGLARYLQMTAEDTEVLSQDPTRRDKLIAELYEQPGLKPNCYASQFVPPGGDPDAHLVPANAEIAKLTPPKSFEDRLHLAFAAMMVYHQYKVAYALRGMPDLERRVRIRRREIMDKWRRDVFDVKFPPRRRGYGASQTPSTPSPTQACLPTVPLASLHDSPQGVSEDEAQNFLSNPHTMIGKQFVHSPPAQGADQDDSGTWEVISYTVKKGDNGGVDHEYQVLLQAFGADPVPMDKEEVRYLLQYSTSVM
ncbi:hypothetical protein GSI_14226 [Ganoderma sinense ZZ0214-1]|uniref:Uncharacterized protein n=1 Tax=Ganoderma sinense ZZ0214-1 TaxID=1077348 RepID=A0A2G8RSI6_9APHY|nr:hypothetical protein GSI_14226 [Ganoderma sinense ZZ0214-1]